jgi:hypothetical protein
VEDETELDLEKFSVNRDARGNTASASGKPLFMISLEGWPETVDAENPLIPKFVLPRSYSYWPGTEPVAAEEIIEDVVPLKSGRVKRSSAHVKKTTGPGRRTRAKPTVSGLVSLYLFITST